MRIICKRAYEPAAVTDGYRVLVDRLWPRGVTKEALALDEWCKEVAPSTELRQWFGHDASRFDEFVIRYRYELDQRGVAGQLLARAGDTSVLTLVYAARDPQVNHAVVLRKYLQSLH